MNLEVYKGKLRLTKAEKYQAINKQNTEMLNGYLQFLRNRGKTESTLNLYEGDILNFMLFIDKDITLTDINDFEKYIEFLQQHKNIKNDTVNRNFTEIKGIITYYLPSSSINDFEKLDNSIDTRPAKPLTHMEIATIEEILNQPQNDKLKLCSIFWHLIYEQGIPNETINDLSFDCFDPTTFTFNTTNETITLNQINGNYMKELIHSGKRLAFDNKNIIRYFNYLSKLTGIDRFISRDIIKTRDNNHFICPLCGKKYENNEANWKIIYGRIACKNCAEKEVKKNKIATISIVQLAIEKANHPFIYKDFKEARKNMKFSLADLQKHNEYLQYIGQLGEKYVLDKEIERLQWTEYEPDYLAEEDVKKGYDILSYDEDGKEICIEVKTSVSIGEPFFMSDKEFGVAKEKGERYFIYRVENILAQMVEDVILTKYQDPANCKNLLYTPNGWKVTVT